MPEKKKALITGVTGQDGSYLVELLLEKGYEVTGLVRRTSQDSLGQAERLRHRIAIVSGDTTDLPSLVAVIGNLKPDEIYNLAAQSHVGRSFKQPLLTVDITGKGAVNVFEAARIVAPKARIYQASSSEMFGQPVQTPQSEDTPLRPANPYAAAKAYAHNMADICRQSYGQPISCGILFNHESPRRGKDFVTQKVALGAACAKLGIKDSEEVGEDGQKMIRDGRLHLGNLEAQRDWGFAGDYVVAMWLMLQKETPDDFVVATGETHTIRELCQAAYDSVGLDYQKFVASNESLRRPNETGPLVGNASKAKRELGWEPKVKFEQLVRMMVTAQIARLK